MSDTLTAKNLKETLWDTLNQIRAGTMQANQGDAVASQAREILRTVKIQLQVANHSKRALPIEVLNFSENAGAT